MNLFSPFELSDDNYKKIYGKLLLVLSITLPLLSFQFGTSWDERMSIKYSNDLLNYFLSFGKDQTCLNKEIQVYNHLIYYGNIFGLITSILNEILPLHIVEIRHVFCAILGFGTISYSGKIGKLIGGYKLGLITVILLLLNLRFIGHSMNGFRDVSFMFGYAASLYFIMKLYLEMPKFNKNLSTKLALSLFFACSVRIGGVILYALLFLVILYYLIEHRNALDKKLKKNITRHFLYIVVLSYSMIIAFWPWAHQNPFTAPFKALMEFSDLQLIVNYQLFDGEMLSNRNVPWSYLFKWIGYTTPIIVLAGLLFVLIKIKSLFKNKKALVAILLTALFIPIIGYFFNSRNLYDSWRHFLFICPIITLFSALGWYNLYNSWGSSLVKKTVIITSVIMAVFPLRAHVTYLPNQTLYFNELIGGLEGAFGKYESDIDANVMRALTLEFNKLREKNPKKKVIVATNCDPLTVSHYLKDKQAAKNIKWLGQDQLYLKDWDYALFSSRTATKEQLQINRWPLKEAIYSLKVDDVPVVSILERQDRNGLIGFNLMNEGRVQEAIPYLQKSLEHNPNNETYQRVTGINYFKSGDLPSAKKHLNKSLEFNSENTFTIYYLAEIAFYEKDFQKSLRLLKKSKEIRFNNYVADCLKATIYYLQNDLPRAKRLLDNLLNDETINKRDLSLISNAYGKIYLNEFVNSNGKCQECAKKANDFFQKAVNYDLKNPEPYMNSIELFRMLGREEDMKQVEELMRKYVK